MLKCVTSVVEAINVSFFNASAPLPYRSTFFIHSLHPYLLPPSPQLFYFSICHAATTGWSNGHYAARCELSLSGVEIKPSWQAGSAASQCPLKRPQKGETMKAKAEVPLTLYLLAPPGMQLLPRASGCFWVWRISSCCGPNMDQSNEVMCTITKAIINTGQLCAVYLKLESLFFC